MNVISIQKTVPTLQLRGFHRNSRDNQWNNSDLSECLWSRLSNPLTMLNHPISFQNMVCTHEVPRGSQILPGNWGQILYIWLCSSKNASNGPAYFSSYFKIYSIFYVFVCVDQYIGAHRYRCPVEAGQGVRSPGAGVTSYWLWMTHLEPNSDPL